MLELDQRQWPTLLAGDGQAQELDQQQQQQP
jgi:hypothetical protein